MPRTHILAIGTSVPAHAYTQAYALERMRGWLPDERLRRAASVVYRRSGIDRRHSVLGDFLPGSDAELFPTDAGGRLVEPGTGARNAVYAREAAPLALVAAQRALADCPRLSARDVTHLVTLSCTGFHNPGPDLALVRNLGLSGATERYHLGFMGCAAALPGLRLADQICRAQPSATVLVVSVELCSLHLQIRPDTDSLLANAIFSDGAGAAVVTARTGVHDGPGLALEGFRTCVVPNCGGDMAWSIGDRGFDITLSSYVPDILRANIGAIVADALGAGDTGSATVDRWAVHPGGRAILDGVESALGLAPTALDVSRAVLRANGNMSSATVLFVLQSLLQEARMVAGERVLAMAFGPGLVVETARMQWVGREDAAETKLRHATETQCEGDAPCVPTP